MNNPIFTKQFFLVLIMLPVIVFAQPKINKITWVGTNNEYLKISKITASFENRKGTQQFRVAQLEKEFVTFGKTYYFSGKKNEYVEQRYNIVYLSKDTLIISPVGIDTFQLGQLNDKHQYLFVNCKSFPPQTINFVRLYFETSLGQYTRIILEIDSSKHSKIAIIDNRYAERSYIKSPIVYTDYSRLISILESYDISRFPEEYFMLENDVQCCNSFFEIEYNGQIKRCRGCTYFPFKYSKLENFIRNHIEVRIGLSVSAPTLRY